MSLNTTPTRLICDATDHRCDLGLLDPDTRYYWRVVVSDEDGATTTGPVWDFTTELTAGTLTSELIGTATGEASGDQFSAQVWSIGDLNHDGYPDWAAQVPPTDVAGASPVDGKVYVFFGGFPLDLSADVTLTAPISGKAFAWRASGVGDVSGDGIDDLVVTQYRDGDAYVYFGGNGAFDNNPDLTLDDGTNEWDTTASSAGDVNGDGHADIAMGIGHDDSCGFDRGKVHVFYGGPLLDGTPDEAMCSADGGDLFGVSLHGGADLNGDGDEDLVVGAWDARSGSVHLYWGGDAWDTSRDLRFDETGQFYGTSGRQLSHGDVNGDSVDDLLVGQDWVDGANAFLYYGGTSMDSTRDATWLDYGGVVAGASDVNADSFDEIVIGNSGADRVSVFSGGAPPSTMPALQLTGDTNGERFGQSVVSGDFDGDGWPELLVGAPWSDDAGTDAGKVYLYRLTAE